MRAVMMINVYVCPADGCEWFWEVREGDDDGTVLNLFRSHHHREHGSTNPIVHKKEEK